MVCSRKSSIRQLEVPIETHRLFKIANKERKPNGYWRNQENRRAFFLSFAEKNGFDAFDPNNWKNEKIIHRLHREVKKATWPPLFPTIELNNSLLKSFLVAYLFAGDLQAALADAFPEIQFGKYTYNQKLFMNDATL